MLKTEGQDYSLSTAEKRIIAEKTGYSPAMIHKMVIGKVTMRPIVKKAIEKWEQEKVKFINS